MRMWRCASVLWVFMPFIVILLTLTKDYIEAREIGTPAKDFKRHTIVTPTVHHARTKRELRSTKDDEIGLHHKELTLTVSVDGETYTLELRLNEDLIPHNHVIRYMENGVPVVRKPSLQELDVCQYSGKIRDKADSWAAISTCHGVRGAIYDGRSMHYIEPGKDESIDSPHFLYNHADMTSRHTCGYGGGVTNNSLSDPELYKRSRGNRYKRSSEEIQVRGPYNANKQSRYVELVLVADNREYKLYGNNMNLLHRKLKDVANIINSLFSPLNIFVALVGVVVWTEHDEIDLSENGDDTLSGFLRYRKLMLPELPNDNAHLLTQQEFKDNVVGKAIIGKICTYALSGGVATDDSEVTAVVATTIAHEMGHNFGMHHDPVPSMDHYKAEKCSCPDDICMMYPSSTSVVPTRWSSCSLKSLALTFERGKDYCLRNKPKSLFESPTCGNGFVEAGEQCDCGMNPGPACSACCVPELCVLRSNATCAAGTCCDLTTCRLKTAGTVCRSADRFCDLPEYCTGHSEYCPDDVYRMDATPCPPSEQAYCVRGSCKSHTAQCRLLWGSTGTMSHRDCYSYNLEGRSNGNCGYDHVKQTYNGCAVADNLCGLLHCKHFNEQLQFGMALTPSHRFIFDNNSTFQPCYTAIMDLGLSEINPGYVPDGAVCGRDKMCMSQKCVSVESVRLLAANKPTSVCPSACSGHGVCNSEGHCHCEAGFAPPLCGAPGPGGSVDSGPATDPTLQKNFIVAMYIIFLGIIPSILLILLLMYYSRHNVLAWWKRPKKPIQSPKKTSLQQRLSKSASKFAANFNSSQAQVNAPPISVHTLH